MKPKKVGKPKIEGLKIQAKIDEEQLEFAKKNNEGKSSAEIVRMGIEALNNGFEKNIDVLTLNDNVELLEVYSGGYYDFIQGITLYNSSKKEDFKELGLSIECDSITQLKGDKFKILFKKENYLSIESSLKNQILDINNEKTNMIFKIYSKYHSKKIEELKEKLKELENLEFENKNEYTLLGYRPKKNSPEKYTPEKYSNGIEDIEKLTIDEIILRINKIKSPEDTQYLQNIKYIKKLENCLKELKIVKKEAKELVEGKILELKNNKSNIFRGLELALEEKHIEDRIDFKNETYSIDTLKEKEQELKKLLLEDYTKETSKSYMDLIDVIISNSNIRFYKNFLSKNKIAKNIREEFSNLREYKMLLIEISSNYSEYLNKKIPYHNNQNQYMIEANLKKEKQWLQSSKDFENNEDKQTLLKFKSDIDYRNYHKELEIFIINDLKKYNSIIEVRKELDKLIKVHIMMSTHRLEVNLEKQVKLLYEYFSELLPYVNLGDEELIDIEKIKEFLLEFINVDLNLCIFDIFDEKYLPIQFKKIKNEKGTLGYSITKLDLKNAFPEIKDEVFSKCEELYKKVYQFIEKRNEEKGIVDDFKRVKNEIEKSYVDSLAWSKSLSLLTEPERTEFEKKEAEKKKQIDKENELKFNELKKEREKRIKKINAEIKRIYNTLPPVEYVIKSQSYSTIKL